MQRRVEVYLNMTPGSAFMAYRPEAEFRCAWRGSVDLPAPTPGEGVRGDMEACSIVYAMGNYDADNPAWDQHRLYDNDRSISVGDVITLDDRSYAVASLGFTEVVTLTGHRIQGIAEDRLAQNFEVLSQHGRADALATGMASMLAEVKDNPGGVPLAHRKMPT